jgi:CHAT domain-containing protein
MGLRPLIVRLGNGSIARARTPAIVLGHFQGIAPGGAELELDEVLRGAILTFVANRSLRGEPGDFFAIPALLGAVFAQAVVVVGLGPPDVFSKHAVAERGYPALLIQISHRLIEGLLATDLIPFATVPLGSGGGGLPVRAAVKAYVLGICSALLCLDSGRRINEFAVVEADKEKMNELRRGLEEAQEELAGQFRFDIRELEIDSDTRPFSTSSISSIGRTTHLSARRKDSKFTYSIFSQCPVQPMVSIEIQDRTLRQFMNDLIGYIESGKNAGEIKEIAATFYELLVPVQIRDLVRSYAGRESLIFNLEPSLAEIPWEMLYDRQAEAFLGEHRVSRQIMREETFRLSARAMDKPSGIDILILANLSGDLEHSECEGRELKEYFRELCRCRSLPVRVDLLTGADLPGKKKNAAVLKALFQGRYEIVHYCGHAYYDAIDPEKSGWMIDLEGPQVVRAYELSKLPQPPLIVFANACQSAAMGATHHVPSSGFSHSLAGAFIKAGVDLYIGNLVEVADSSAHTFAKSFYEFFFGEGRSIGAALGKARRKIIEDKRLADPTWANYVLYGSPEFRLGLRETT